MPMRPRDERDGGDRRRRRSTRTTPGSTSASTCRPTSGPGEPTTRHRHRARRRDRRAGRRPGPHPPGVDAPDRRPAPTSARSRTSTPSRPASAGVFAVEADLPDRRRPTRVHTEFRRQGQMADVLDRARRSRSPATRPAPTRSLPTTSARRRSSTASGSSSTARRTSGETSDLAFAFTDAATGRPVDDLQPYLGAAGHVVVMRADGDDVRARARRRRGRRRRPGVRAARAPSSGPSSTCTPSSRPPAPTGCGRSSGSPTATWSPLRSPSRPAERRPPERS